MAFGFLKSSKLDVSIDLDRPLGPYYPGDIVKATITIHSDSKVKIRQAYTGLALWEKYKYETEDSEGDRSTATSTTEDFSVKAALLGEVEIPAGFHEVYDIELPIPPDAVPPYDGKITQNKWLAKVTLDRRMKKDFNAEAEILLTVPRPGQAVQAGQYGTASHPGKADMRIELPRLEWEEGERIEGKLLVSPQGKLKFREMRIELVRREHVPRDEGKSHTVTEDKVQLAGKTELRPGQLVEVPFALTIPQQGCPTRRTAHSTVTWTIKGVLPRRLAKDFTVTQEVYVYNGGQRE